MSTNDGAGARYSGAESKAGVVMAVVAATAVAAFVLSWPYNLIALHIPHILANAILPFLMGWLVGVVGRTGLKIRRIHSYGHAIAIGAAGGLFAIWFSWLSYFFIASGYNMTFYLRCLLNPPLLWANIIFRAHNPAWAMGGQGGLPWVYYTVWALEGAVVIAVACYFCVGFLIRNKICEKCGDWVLRTGDVTRFFLPKTGARQTLQALSRGELTQLHSLTRVARNETIPTWLEVRGYACPNCLQEDGMVSVSVISMKYEKQSSRVVRKEKFLTRFVPVTVREEKEIFEPGPEK